MSDDDQETLERMGKWAGLDGAFAVLARAILEIQQRLDAEEEYQREQAERRG